MSDDYYAPQSGLQIVKIKHPNAERADGGGKGSIDFLLSAAILGAGALGGYMALYYAVKTGIWDKIFGGLSLSNIETSLSGLVPEVETDADVARAYHTTELTGMPAAIVFDIDDTTDTTIDPLFGYIR